MSIKLLQPFPEAELVAALAGKKAVTVLERSDVNGAHHRSHRRRSSKARRERERRTSSRHPGNHELPEMTTAIFGLGAHDLQPRHLIAAYKNMETNNASVRLSRLAVLREQPDSETRGSCRRG